MARRYGNAEKNERKWKKLSGMNKTELDTFKTHLESQNQVSSKVYSDVVKRMSLV